MVGEWEVESERPIEASGDWEVAEEEIVGLSTANEAYEKKYGPLERLGLRLKGGYHDAIAASGMAGAVEAADTVNKLEQLSELSTAPASRIGVSRSATSGSPGEVSDVAGRPLVGPGGRTMRLDGAAIGEGAERARSDMARGISTYVEHSKQGAAIPRAPVADAALKAKTFGDAWDAFTTAPVSFIAETGVRSLPQMVLPLAEGVVAASVGGVPGFMAGTAHGSYQTDRAAELASALQDEGVNTTDPTAVTAALTDPALLERVKSRAGTHASVVALFDGLSAGLASKTLVPKFIGNLVARELTNVGVQTGAQGAMGAAGEAGGQLASGQELKPGEVLAEAAGEMISAPADVAGAAVSGLRTEKDAAPTGRRRAPSEWDVAEETPVEAAASAEGPTAPVSVRPEPVTVDATGDVRTAVDAPDHFDPTEYAPEQDVFGRTIYDLASQLEDVEPGLGESILERAALSGASNEETISELQGALRERTPFAAADSPGQAPREQGQGVQAPQAQGVGGVAPGPVREEVAPLQAATPTFTHGVKPENRAAGASFQATHELPDGTPVIAAGEPNVWIDENGEEIEDRHAQPIEATRGRSTGSRAGFGISTEPAPRAPAEAAVQPAARNENVQGATPVGQLGGEKTPDAVVEPTGEARKEGATKVRLYRGTKPGTDPRDTKNTVGGGLFYSDRENVARNYAGKDGTVIEDNVTFDNLLSVKNWQEGKKRLGLPKSATMDELVRAAAEAGHDGLSFDTTNGREYVRLPTPERDRRQASAPVAEDRREGDRRQDADTRKRLDEMSPDELRAEVERLRRESMISKKGGGLPNKDAFDQDEALGWEHAGAADMDGMGFNNEVFGHLPTDELIAVIGRVLARYASDRVRFYHFNGDEFAARAVSREDLDAAFAAAQAELDATNVIINGHVPEGPKVRVRINGIGLTYGLGDTYEDADANASARKEVRAADGERTPKGTNTGRVDVLGEGEGDSVRLGYRGESKEQTIARLKTGEYQDKQTPADAGVSVSGADEKKAAAILKAAKVMGKDRLDIMAKVRAGEYSLKDLEEAYPAQEQQQNIPENIPADVTDTNVGDMAQAPEISQETNGSPIDEAAHEAATSPQNDLPEPTDAMKRAGNYRKGHITLHGLDIAIENPAGSERSGTDASGKPWSVTMEHHYGYIKRTEGKDGDHLDVFLGPDAENADLPVFVIDQVDPKTGRFDEHKNMIGFADEQAARAGYLANYDEGWQGIGGVTEMSLDEFKGWVKEGDTTKRLSARNEKPADPGAAWDAMTADERLAVTMRAGWVTGKETPNFVAKAMVRKKWADINENSQRILREKGGISGSTSETQAEVDPLAIIREVSKKDPFAEYETLRDKATKRVKEATGKDWDSFEESRGTWLSNPMANEIADGRAEGVSEYAKTLPVRISQDAIPVASATQAFAGTSHSPERRGASVRREYLDALVNLWRRHEDAYNSAAEDRKAQFVEAFNKTSSKYASLINAYLAAHSRVMSSMIVGPARFPVESNRKKSDTADRMAQEASEYIGKASKRLAKILRGSVDNSLASQVSEAEAKLADRERDQERMKAVNAALRKGNDDALRSMGLDDAEIARLKKPDFAGRTGYPDYALKNNNAEIRRLRDRVEDLKRRVQAADEQSEHSADQQATLGVRMVRNAEIGRLQMFFDEKPPEVVRSELKAAAFKWSPSTGAWQRQLTENAVRAAGVVIKKHYPQTSGETETTSLARHRRQQISEEMVYRTANPAAGMQAETVREAIAPIVLTWGDNAPVVEVVATQTDLPAHIQQQIGEGGAVQGVHDSATGTVYLIADNLANKADAYRILAHEAVGHYGLEEAMGDQYKKAIDRVKWLKRMGHKQVRELSARVAEAYPNADPDTEAREILAMLAEERQFGSVFKDMAARIYAAVRGFLRKLGFKVLWSTPEIDAMLARAARYLRESGGKRRAVAEALYHRQLGDIDVELGKGGRFGASKFATENPDVAANLEDLVAGAELVEETVTWATLENDGVRFDLVKKNGRWVLTDARVDFARSPFTETEAFKRWFGDSKVVDADGKPLVVYHGTGADIEQFDTLMLGANTRAGSAKAAFFFTSSPNVATGYAALSDSSAVSRGQQLVRASESEVLTGETRAFLENAAKHSFSSPEARTDEATFLETGFIGGAKVLPVYISIQNPLVVDYGGKDYRERRFSDVIRQAKEEGRDGVIFKSAEDSMHKDYAEVSDIYAVFSPGQIKSATGNRGTFDPDDSRINFARKAPEQQWADIEDMAGERPTGAEFAKNPAKYLGDKVDDLRPVWLGALTRRHLADVGGDVLPQVKAYVNTAARLDADRNKMTTEAAEIAHGWSAWARENPDEADAMAALMHDATVHGVDPAAEYQAVYNTKDLGRDIAIKQEQMRGRGGDAYKLQDQIEDLRKKAAQEHNREEAYPKLMARWQRLSPEAQRRYIDVRDYYTRRFKETQQALEDRIRRAKITDSEKRAALTKIRKHFESLQVQAPYFPLARFGDFWVSAENKDGQREFYLFENSTKQKQEAAKLRLKGYKVHTGKKLENIRAIHGASESFVMDLIAIVDEAGGGRMAESIKDSIYQLYLSTLPDLSMRKHFLHRSKTKGFSGDALRAFAKAAFHGAYQLARLKHVDIMETQMTDMREAIRDMEGEDANKAADILNEVEKRHEWMLNPTSAAWAQKASSLNFLWYLGVSPAAAAVNTTQTALVAYPVMASKYGWGKAGAALSKASAEFMGGKFDISQKLEGDELRAFTAMVDEGVIDKTMSHDLAGVAETPTAIYSDRTAKVAKVISFLFHHAERANREITAMAAYRLARGAGKGHDAALQEARDITWESHFDYSNANKARFMQGNGARVLLMFRQYSLNMTYLLARNAQQALKGADAETRAMARRKLAGILGMHSLFVGSMGMPMFWAVELILNSLFDDEDEPWDFSTEYRNFLADTLGQTWGEAVAKGPVDAIFGTGFQNRVSLNELWFREPGQDLEGQEWAEHWLIQAWGPTGGIVTGIGRGVELIREGHVQRGIEAMTPKFVRDGLKAVRYADEGVRNLRGDAIEEDTSAWQELQQLAGMTPGSIAAKYDRKRAIQNYETRIEDRRQMLINRWALAYRLKDKDGRKEAEEEITRFNKKNPSVAIKLATLIKSLKARSRASAETKNGIRLSKGLRGLDDRVRFGEEEEEAQ